MASSGTPSDALYYQVAKQCYQNPPLDQIGTYRLVFDTPTVRAFCDLSTKTLIVGIRGTVNLQDWNANILIPFNNIRQSTRYKNDINSFKALKQRYPPALYTWYGTGHSLGGTLMLAFNDTLGHPMKHMLLFNGALMPSQVIRQDPTAVEYYMKEDPLYRATGWMWRNKKVFNAQGLDDDGIVSSGKDALTAHRLIQFESLVGGWKTQNGKQAHVELERILNTPLSDDDLRTLLGAELNVIEYRQLASYSRIEDGLDPQGRLCILLEEQENMGHWVGVLQTGGSSLEVINSYGEDPDAELAEWVSPEQRAKLGEGRPLLTQLLRDATRRGWDVVYESKRLQGKTSATCGRYVALRMLLSDVPLDDFYKALGPKPDAVVAIVTQILLDR